LRRARHHTLSRRSERQQQHGRSAAGDSQDGNQLLHRRQADSARRRRAVHRPDDSRGARRAHRLRPAARDSADCPRRPRTSGAADQGRLRRQEHPDRADPERAGAPDGNRRPRRGGGPAMKKDLLGIADLSPDDIYRVLETAEAMREVGQRPIKKVPTLRGKTVVNLFYEPSTRTRTSFEIAEKRLSADTLNVAVSASSVLKGETL